MIPDYLVHYYLPHKKPFLNLSDLSENDRDSVAGELNKRAEEGQMRRAFPDWYFVQRKEAEENMLKAYIERGGKPERTAPHYFSLGESLGMEFVYNNNFKKIIAPIAEFKTEVLFSIGDTLWTFANSQNPDQQWENKWYQGKLYTYAETCAIIKKINLDLTSKDSLNKNQVFQVEAVVWSDQDIEKLI